MDPAPNGIISKDPHLSVYEKIRELIVQYGRNWEDIEMLLIDQYHRVFESTDIGDIDEFDPPTETPIIKS
jgi:hypothetical protein